MKNKKGYLQWLEGKIERLHNCDATYHETVPVHVVFHSKTVWPPEAEVFGLVGHPTAKLAYAWGSPVAYEWDQYEWGHIDESDDGLTMAFVVLELPPVDSAQKAVQVHIEKAEKDLRQAKRILRNICTISFPSLFLRQIEISN